MAAFVARPPCAAGGGLRAWLACRGAAAVQGNLHADHGPARLHPNVVHAAPGRGRAVDVGTRAAAPRRAALGAWAGHRAGDPAADVAGAVAGGAAAAEVAGAATPGRLARPHRDDRPGAVRAVEPAADAA